MNWFTRKLTCTQLDSKLKALKGWTIPPKGWVKTLRTTLGMSSRQLAKRCGVTEQRIQSIEHNEVAKRTTLKTLDKIASQLNCNFVYAFVPKTSIISVIEAQAEQKAKEKLAVISHSMSLEDQKLEDSANRAQRAMLKKELMELHIRKIWE